MFYSRKKLLQFNNSIRVFFLKRGQEKKGAGKKLIVSRVAKRSRFEAGYKLYKFPNRKFKGVWWMP